MNVYLHACVLGQLSALEELSCIIHALKKHSLHIFHVADSLLWIELSPCSPRVPVQLEKHMRKPKLAEEPLSVFLSSVSHLQEGDLPTSA